MRVLLGLGGVELPKAVARQHLGHRVPHLLLREGDRAREVRAVARHRRHVEAALEQPLRELARAVGAEVEVDHGVVAPERGRLRVDERLDELVRHARVVAPPHVRHRVCASRPGSVRDRRDCAVGALPALVPVHRPVAAHHVRDPLARELGQIGDGRCRRDVASVREGVDPRPLRHSLLLGEPQQRLQVVEVRMDAAVRDEPEQVDVPAPLACARERADERLVREEAAVADRAVDALEVHVDDAARADRQVPDLRVPHLAGREPDRLAARLQRRVRVLPPEPVEHRRRRELDRVPGAGRRAAPPVEDDERYERDAAAWQIARNESGSRDAPPTSAPSTAGIDSSSWAFSGFTEPP